MWITGMTPMQLTCMPVAVASGATFLSHVIDSSFWLVSQYLGLTEKQTSRSWTVMTMLVGVTGLVCAGLLFYLFLSL
jgi:Gnt-I system low-affinity gluconate transporter